MKIKFKDLDVWLKIAVIGGWGIIVIYVASFLIGFFIGLSS